MGVRNAKLSAEVSIHAPAWGATPRPSRIKTGSICFNPRTRVGCDQTTQQPVKSSQGFNPRTRVGCDPPWNRRTPMPFQFQSTHPRGVRLFAGAQSMTPFAVSIHAPAWGATRLVPRDAPFIFGFNPRTRVGCDHAGLRPAGGQKVSIHAPAWGATHPGRARAHGRQGFNPRTRVGCDTDRCHKCADRRGFQSTHPRGVRRVMDPEDYANIWVSIHAPAWGATCPALSARPRSRVSIHAPAWGATIV